ncbi:hypothetical protein B0G75_1232 [Paraburkholderia sp. BL18I3N2]|uniref:hypothetical protein n=1 Tax=Paraburkholderia sp. BL18I3N2 TaxID=1938799 RepID=UPI000D4FF96E|nr:hypothetical protein [Paraburkholderia sp. BL18I3N2]PRX24098.1 hypothetical protein B0G75_1232 [Paraburkholderia sp. BL18I3N2]
MNYKKFIKQPSVELQLLSSIQMLTEERLVFKISNSPDYSISNYDRHRMETYFFADSHSFPENVSFVLHAEKEGETIVADCELNDYRVEWDIDDYIDDSEDVLSEVLAKNGEIAMAVDCVDEFELHGIRQPLVDNTNKSITFVGGYRASYAGIQPDEWSLYAICDVLGISKRTVDDNTHLGVLAEGLAMMLRGDYKIASFMFYCALEAYINFKLECQSDKERLSEKLKRLVVDVFPSIEISKHLIYTSIVNEFDLLSGFRNAIAHGSKAVTVSKKQTISHLTLVLTLIACIETGHENFSSLATELSTSDFSQASTQFWSSWKDGD